MDALLEEAIAAHGGAERWAGVDEVRLEVRSGGFALASKLKRRIVSHYRAEISTGEPHVVVHPFTAPGMRGVFTPESVRIEDAGGEVVSERRDARAKFPGGRRALWWDDLDILYFAGYAMWGYANAPFLFAREGFAAREIEPWEEDGETWRRLAVTFPPDVPAHSREQVFYFDERGMLRRNDYTAEPFGRWARGAHYSHDHRTFDGIAFPTRRRVYPRLPSNRPAPWPTLVWIDLERVEPVSAARG
jgi:hypothetical protein